MACAASPRVGLSEGAAGDGGSAWCTRTRTCLLCSRAMAMPSPRTSCTGTASLRSMLDTADRSMAEAAPTPPSSSSPLGRETVWRTTRGVGRVRLREWVSQMPCPRCLRDSPSPARRCMTFSVTLREAYPRTRTYPGAGEPDGTLGAVAWPSSMMRALCRRCTASATSSAMNVSSLPWLLKRKPQFTSADTLLRCFTGATGTSPSSPLAARYTASPCLGPNHACSRPSGVPCSCSTVSTPRSAFRRFTVAQPMPGTMDTDMGARNRATAPSSAPSMACPFGLASRVHKRASSLLRAMPAEAVHPPVAACTAWRSRVTKAAGSGVPVMSRYASSQDMASTARTVPCSGASSRTVPEGDSTLKSPRPKRTMQPKAAREAASMARKS